MAIEDSWESLGLQGIKPLNPKGSQPKYSTEGSILWPPDEKSWLTGKDPDTGGDWGQEEKGAAEDEMFR